jgi:hypothetical protein
MALPLAPLALGAAGLLYLVLRKDETRPPAPTPVPAALPVNPPPPPSPLLAKVPVFQPSLAPKGYGAEVFLSFDPNAPSVKQNVQAMRYLGFTGLVPSDVQGNPESPDYMDAVKVLQNFVGLPQTGTVDVTTQDALTKQVLARNAQIHADNASKNLTDTDYIAYQTKLGASDPRGAWSIT